MTSSEPVFSSGIAETKRGTGLLWIQANRVRAERPGRPGPLLLEGIPK